MTTSESIRTYRRPWITGLIAAGVSGVLYFFSTGLNPVGALLFIAPLPVLVVSRRLSAGKTFVVSFLASAIGTMNFAVYLAVFMPPPLLISTLVLFSGVFGLTILAHRAAQIRLAPLLSPFVFPSTWTAFEFLRSIASPNGTGGSIAYTQTNFLALIQVSSLTGMWGIVFIVTLIPAVLAVAWSVKSSMKQIMGALAIPALIAAFILVFGYVRMTRDWRPQAMPVGLAVTDTTIKYFQSENPAESLPVIRAYADRAADLSGFGARVVVLPEKFAAVTVKSDSIVRSIFSQTAMRDSIVIVAGLNVMGTDRDTNAAVVYFPDGKILEYQKKYLVPGFEAKYFSGRTLLTFSLGERSAGIEICKDMDFPEWSREYAARGATILFVPAWDFTVDGELHMRMAILRGVENGFSIVRCAQQGLLTVSDFRGKIIAEEPSSKSPEVLLLSYVSPGPGRTFYSITGDWFGWLSVAATAALILTMLPGTRKD